jgi:hypothetical protein
VLNICWKFPLSKKILRISKKTLKIFKKGSNAQEVHETSTDMQKDTSSTEGVDDFKIIEALGELNSIHEFQREPIGVCHSMRLQQGSGVSSFLEKHQIHPPQDENPIKENLMRTVKEKGLS